MPTSRRRYPLFLAALVPLTLLAGARDASAITYASQVLANAPVAYWRLNEPGTSYPTASDSTTNHRDATYQNQAHMHDTGPFTSDPTSFSTRMDGGSSSYVEKSPDNAFTPGNSGWSVELWTNSQTSGTLVYWYQNGGASLNNGLYYLGVNSDGSFSYQFRDNPGISVSINSGAIAGGLNAWHHVVGTYAPGVGMKIYVDGLLKNSNAQTFSTIGEGVATSIDIGANPKQGQFGYQGKIAEVAIYSSALTGAQVLADYQAGIGVPEPGSMLLVAAALLLALARPRGL